MAGKRAVYIAAAFTLILCMGFTVLSESSFAQTPKKKKKKKSSVSLAPPSNFKPTMTGAPGTVKFYFFPTDTGTWWKMRTVQILIDQNDSVVRADTLFNESLVVNNKKFSLQQLPLLLISDSSYKTSGTGIRSESEYYVDDSVAMTVFNNSITSGENRIFLVAPLVIGNAWHEKSEDSMVTVIGGFVDSVVTPIGTFDSVLVTVTKEEFSDMRKYYVPGRGIVKTIFRSVGPGGRGLVIVKSEMIAFRKPDEIK